MLLEQNVFKIVATGPESSGKTTLANQLAAALEVPCVPEFARSYVAHVGHPYQREDLHRIARGQQLWEDWFARMAGEQLPHQPTMIVCDTDWTVIYVWEQHKYGKATFSLLPPMPPPLPLYLLCASDIPWEPDPLREHPAERQALFGQYIQLLDSIHAAYFILRGDAASRLETALQIVHKYYRP